MADDNGESSMTDSSPPTDVEELREGVLELNHVYEALSHPRRRYLVYTLAEDTEWTLDDLARKIAAWEQDVSPEAVTDEQRKRIAASLYHAHIPKLVDEGIITFDEATETIHAADHAEQVQIALSGMGASLDAAQEDHAKNREN